MSSYLKHSGSHHCLTTSTVPASPPLLVSFPPLLSLIQSLMYTHSTDVCWTPSIAKALSWVTGVWGSRAQERQTVWVIRRLRECVATVSDKDHEGSSPMVMGTINFICLLLSGIGIGLEENTVCDFAFSRLQECSVAAGQTEWNVTFVKSD